MADECTCETWPCICDDMNKMMEELESIRIINKGFKASLDSFDVGPGAAVSTGEQMINIYFWHPERGRDLELHQDPALVIGLPKAAAAKLLWSITQVAKDFGWMESDNDDN